MWENAVSIGLDTSDMTAAVPSSLGVRVKRVALFVAVVWAVAGSFIALELASLAGVDAAVAYPGVFGNIAVARSASRSTLCDVTSASTAAATSPQLLAGAWTLGLRLGREAEARQSPTVKAETLVQARAGVEQVAALLQIPAPARFEPTDLATANIAFVNTIEADTQGTAKALATVRSPLGRDGPAGLAACTGAGSASAGRRNEWPHFEHFAFLPACSAPYLRL